MGAVRLGINPRLIHLRAFRGPPEARSHASHSPGLTPTTPRPRAKSLYPVLSITTKIITAITSPKTAGMKLHRFVAGPVFLLSY